MARYIQLQRSDMVTYVDGRTQGFRYTIEVIRAVDMPSEIFVYQRKPIISDTSHEDVFSNIASPTDIEEYPVGDPASADRPFFRASAVDLVFRNLTLAEDAWEAIQSDVEQLVWALNMMDTLEPGEVASFGTAPQSSSSSSSSSSPSP